MSEIAVKFIGIPMENFKEIFEKDNGDEILYKYSKFVNSLDILQSKKEDMVDLFLLFLNQYMHLIERNTDHSYKNFDLSKLVVGGELVGENNENNEPEKSALFLIRLDLENNYISVLSSYIVFNYTDSIDTSDVSTYNNNEVYKNLDKKYNLNTKNYNVMWKATNKNFSQQELFELGLSNLMNGHEDDGSSIFKELISSLMNGNGISNITPQQIAKINKKIRQQMNSKRDDVEEKIYEIPENQRFYVTTSDKLLKRIGEVEELSPHEQQNVTMYLNNILKESKYIKEIVDFNEQTVENLENLKSKFNNFSDIIDYYKAQIKLGRKHFQPILLLGEPGIGKTYFANAMAEAMGIKSYFKDISSINNPSEIVGSNNVYRDSSAGFIANKIFNDTNDKLIMVLDEIDKVSNSENSNAGSLLNPFHVLLEEETVSKFEDIFIKTDINASGVIFIATANEINNIPSSILSRFKIFDVRRPSKDVILKIMDEMYVNVFKENKKTGKKKTLDKKLKDLLLNNNLRDIKRLVEEIAFLETNNGTKIKYIEAEKIVNNYKKTMINNVKNKFFNFVDRHELNVNINDIFGNKNAKEEIEFIVKNMLDKSNTHKQHYKAPKGILFTGSSGVGKTMMAKALATKLNTNFIYLSASAFKSKYVGETEENIRVLFKKAKDYAPCVIFIDEIDSFGSRNNNTDEHSNSAINEMLVQLDGMEENQDVLVLAATNHEDKIDNALIRAGRFDRIIKFNNLSFDERKEMIVHLGKKYNYSKKLDINFIAKNTVFMSPAEIENMINQAAIISSRLGKNEIDIDDMEEAQISSSAGAKNLSIVMDRKVTAYHEVGHAIVSKLLNNNVRSVSIIPRDRSLGVTAMNFDDIQASSRTKNEMLNGICVSLAGQCAEQIFCGEISTGASADIKSASKTARDMIVKYGFSENEFLGMIDYSELSNLSEKTKEAIEMETLKIIKSEKVKCNKILHENKDAIDEMVELLLEREVIYDEDMSKILANSKINYQENLNLDIIESIKNSDDNFKGSKIQIQM